MPSISLTLPVAGTVITSGLHATNYTTLQTLLNGGLDTANWASGKIFPPSKLTQEGAATGYGLQWDGSQWAPAGSMFRLFDSILGVDTANFDITPISGAYSALRLLMYVRDAAAGAVLSLLRAQFNGDAGANYDFQLLTANAAVANGAELFGQTSAQLGDVVQNGAGANLFSSVTVDIPHYAGATNNKVFTGFSSAKVGTGAGGMEARQSAGFWRSNAAITRITLFSSGGNFKAGSRCTLYGLA